MNQLDNLMISINYRFTDERLLDLAMTHSSYANERTGECLDDNERLEFLGDSVLGIVVSDYLYKTYGDLPEGELSKIRSLVVCEGTLSEVANRLDIGQYLKLGKGESLTGGREKPSILSDAVEALIAAIYLDGGFKAAQSFVLKQLSDSIKQAVGGKIFKDYKSALQEFVQSGTHGEIAYQIVAESGPDHNKEFFANVVVGGVVCGEGRGRSKKHAEQQAAKVAMQKYIDKA